MMSTHYSTPPASNRFTSRSLSTYTPPTGGGPFGSEAEPELIQPSPHFLDRGLEALRQKKAKGALQLAVGRRRGRRKAEEGRFGKGDREARGARVQPARA